MDSAWFAIIGGAVGVFASGLMNVATNYHAALLSSRSDVEKEKRSRYDELAQIIAVEIERHRMSWAMINAVPTDADGTPTSEWSEAWKNLESKRHANRIEIFRCAARITIVENDRDFRLSVEKIAEGTICIVPRPLDSETASRVEKAYKSFHASFEDLCEKVRVRQNHGFSDVWKRYFADIPKPFDE